jgi:sulfite reductase beta subunit-like hemoprotein
MTELSRNERIKEASAYLRGTLADGLTRAETGAIAEDDQQLVKFHGMYLQDDRDLRPERTRKKLEKAFSFMVRLRIPGGVCSPEQWLQLDRIARDYTNGTLRLTTRQTFQFHGVIKSNLKRTMGAIDAALLDTLAACGDVNRNVLPASYPRTADAMAFCHPEDALAVAKAVVTVQRDWGDRTSRKHARLKYTIEDCGLAVFRAEVERRLGKALEEPRPFAFSSNGDRYGWVEAENGFSHLTLFIENGRLRDVAGGPSLLTGLRRIAGIHDGEFRLTANQNVIVANVRPANRAIIDELVAEYGLTAHATALRRNAMACVALPTCGLALAESERYLPDLVIALEGRLAAHGLGEDEITIRMTGCPNGCARPYIAEIGLVGKGPGRYNLYLGGAFDGSRLSKLYAEDLGHDGIVAALDPLFAAYAKKRRKHERFGDFLIRTKHIARTRNGADFHADTGALDGATAPEAA